MHLFYSALKFICRVSLSIYCRRLVITGKSFAENSGPTIFLANHPNSFLDGILIGTASRYPVHFTIRSDIFRMPLIGGILKALKGIPIFRQTEDSTRLRENRQTFEECVRVLKNNGSILLFAEGFTEHKWEIKPIKSGPARLIWDALQEDELRDKLSVIPVGITYNQYQKIGKHIYLNAGEPLQQIIPEKDESYGVWKTKLKHQVREAIRKLAFHFEVHPKKNIPFWRIVLSCAKQLHSDKHSTVNWLNNLSKTHVDESRFSVKIPANNFQPYFPFSKKQLIKDHLFVLLLLLPAVASLILNSLFYFGLRKINQVLFEKTIHFDGAFFCLLTFIFPLYWLLLGLIIGSLTGISAWKIIAASAVSGILSNFCWQHLASLYNYYRMKQVDRNKMETFAEALI